MTARPRSLGPTAAVAASVLLASAASGGAAPHGCPAFTAGLSSGSIGAAGLTELSGLAASRTAPGVLWAHNDSGDSARLFAIRDDGTLLGIYALGSTTMTDWEDIAIGPGPVAETDYLYVGDIGDNGASRPSVTVHRVAEPAVDPDQAPVTTTIGGVDALEFVYPGGAAYDAETLLVDPVTGDLVIVTKDGSGISRVFGASAPHTPGPEVVLAEITTLTIGSDGDPSLARSVTGGDWSTAGDRIVLRSYLAAWTWRRVGIEPVGDVFGRSPCPTALRVDLLWLQGEAVAFAAGESGAYFTASEGASPPLIRYDSIPRLPDPTMVGADLVEGGMLRVRFVNDGDPPSAFALERAPAPGAGAPWAEDPSAVPAETAPSEYSIDVANPGAGARAEFYRIVARP